MTVTSRINIDDGTTSVNVDGHATLSVRLQSSSAGGATNLRMANGAIVRQVAWEKLSITLTCSGWVPPALSSIDWSEQITLTVPAAGGTTQYVGYADPPQETKTAAEEIDCEWILSLEEG